jgi:uncharacterized protein YjbI with pentapeptide repeats
MSDEQHVPKWGDPIESIPEARRAELKRLHDEQVKWAAEPHPDPYRSPFAKATGSAAFRVRVGAGVDAPVSQPLTGAEVFFLAANALAWPKGDLAQTVLQLSDVASYPILLFLHLEGASLEGAHLDGAVLNFANLEGADLTGAHLEVAYLAGAHLDDAHLPGVHLEGSYLGFAHLGRADLSGAHLEGAHLEHSILDSSTLLNDAVITNERYGSISVVDVRWQGVNLAVMDWNQVALLGDEQSARFSADEDGPKNGARRIQEYEVAVRANRQLALVLRAQGINEHANRFAYRAQVVERDLLWMQKRYFTCAFSWFLFAATGYGQKLYRIAVTYAAIVAFFAILYFLRDLPRSLDRAGAGAGNALIRSLTAFHSLEVGISALAHPWGPTWGVLEFAEGLLGLIVAATLVGMLVQRLRAGNGG